MLSKDFVDHQATYKDMLNTMMSTLRVDDEDEEEFDER
jgi:hypothetical protein